MLAAVAEVVFNVLLEVVTLVGSWKAALFTTVLVLLFLRFFTDVLHSHAARQTHISPMIG